MKLTNIEADNLLQALNNISDKVSGKSAYIIARNIRKLDDELQEYIKIKNEIIIKYGEKGEDGLYNIQINTDAFENYVAEMSKYMDIEINVDIMMIPPDDIFDTQLTAADILSIDLIIMEEEDAKSV